jgi:hypothetical protein
MSAFLTGTVAMGFLIAGLFFLRFWRRTNDMLFAAFAIAFLLFAVQQSIVGLSGIPREELSWTFLLRLAGFALLIVAILVKNFGRPTRPK